MSDDRWKDFLEDVFASNERLSIQRALEETPSESSDFSKPILAQLQADLENPLPCQYDFEFISAYLDGELSSDCPEPQLVKLRSTNFEKHLPQCTPCTQLLGGFVELRERYRQMLYRLEAQLDAFDISEAVISIFNQPETAGLDNLLSETVQLPVLPCGMVSIEQLSAYLDSALPQPEAGFLETHLADCVSCQNAHQQLAHVIACVHQAYENQANQQVIPDLWPRLLPQLSQSPGKVYAFPSPRKKRSWLPVAGVVAAASVLLAVFSGPLWMPSSHTLSQTAINPHALQAALIADQQEAMQSGGIVSPRYTINTMYQSPEAYLFSPDSDFLDEESLGQRQDVSAIVLNSSP